MYHPYFCFVPMTLFSSAVICHTRQRNSVLDIFVVNSEQRICFSLRLMLSREWVCFVTPQPHLINVSTQHAIQSQRGSRGTVLLILNLGNRWGCLRALVLIVDEAGWAPLPVWMGEEKISCPHRGWNPKSFHPVAIHYAS